MDRDKGGFDAWTARAFSELGVGGEERFVDAMLDPTGALDALQHAGAEPWLLRVCPDTSKPAAPDDAPNAASGPKPPGLSGPQPREPVWIRVEGPSLKIAGRTAAARVTRAVCVALEAARESCCDAPACSLERECVTLFLDVESDGDADPLRFVVGSFRAPLGEMGSRPERLAAALAKALGVTVPALSSDAASPAGDRDGLDAEVDAKPATAPLDAHALARYALHAEADRIVLRDWADLGQQESARRNRVTAIVSGVVAAGLWYAAVRGLLGAREGQAVAFGSVAALVSIASYAFFGVARYAAQYSGVSKPLIAVSRDRFIVSPWVSRTGAIELRPDGRLGAAIAIGELRGVSVQARDQRFAIEIANDHGPIDVLSTRDAAVAEVLATALLRVLNEARHPGAGASPRQRARARGSADKAPENKPAN